MNTENLTRVADIIEASTAATDVRFDMEHWVSSAADAEIDHFCGTVACIAGYASILEFIDEGLEADEAVKAAKRKADDWYGTEDTARDWLGLTNHQAGLLFRGEFPHGDSDDDIDLETVTAEIAVAVLRDLIANGTIRWTHFGALTNKETRS